MVRMSDNEVKNCYSCDKYIASVGEKGYCKLYHHETPLPEKPCPRFEPKQVIDKTGDFSVQENSGKDESIKNILIVGAFFASTVLTIIGMMFSFNLSMSVLTVEKIPILFKLVTIVLSVAFILLFSYVLFILGKRFLWARIAEIILTIIVVVVNLVFSTEIFETFSNYILRYIELLASHLV